MKKFFRRHGPYPPVTHIGRFSFHRTTYVPFWTVRVQRENSGLTVFLPGIVLGWDNRA